jgi:tetratricopeptide (TPR) repeat protein
MFILKYFLARSDGTIRDGTIKFYPAFLRKQTKMNIKQFKLKVSTQNIFASISLLIFISSLIMISCSDNKVSEELQSNYLTPEVLCGTVQFTDGCSPQLDSLISFGFALIHHMTYDDAEYTFNKVIELDPDCFWGYWGKAMTYIHPLWPDVPSEERMDRGWFLSQTALSLAKTDKEKLYGAAVASYYNSELDNSEGERLAEYKKAWLQVHRQLPDDLEAQLFYVLTMLATVSPDDKSYDIQREAGAIAENSLEIIPDHPGGFHYAIHAYDFPPLAPSALRVARRYNEIAPEIPHALHMPTHIFTRLGKWQESIDLNVRSAAAAWRLPVNGQISLHYFHALDYLAYAHLQQSEYDKVEAITTTIDTLSNVFQVHPATAYALAAIKGRMALEYQQWTDAANISLEYESKVPWDKFPQYESLVYFAKGIGGGRSGNSEIAKLSYEKLESLQNSLGDSRASQYWIAQIEVQKTVIKAWQKYAEKDMEKAKEIMFLAAELEDATEKNPVTPGELLPVREMLGDLLLEMNQPDEALLQYELSLTTSPNRFNSLYGAGKSAELIGDKEKARDYFTTLIELSGGSDLSRERLQYASNIINEL